MKIHVKHRGGSVLATDVGLRAAPAEGTDPEDPDETILILKYP